MTDNEIEYQLKNSNSSFVNIIRNYMKNQTLDIDSYNLGKMLDELKKSEIIHPELYPLSLINFLRDFSESKEINEEKIAKNFKLFLFIHITYVPMSYAEALSYFIVYIYIKVEIIKNS